MWGQDGFLNPSDVAEKSAGNVELAETMAQDKLTKQCFEMKPNLSPGNQKRQTAKLGDETKGHGAGLSASSVMARIRVFNDCCSPFCRQELRSRGVSSKGELLA